MKKSKKTDSKLFGSVTVGAKGQLVIPVEARNQLDIKPGDQLLVFGSDENAVLAIIKAEKISDIIGNLTSIKDITG